MPTNQMIPSTGRSHNLQKINLYVCLVLLINFILILTRLSFFRAQELTFYFLLKYSAKYLNFVGSDILEVCSKQPSKS